MIHTASAPQRRERRREAQGERILHAAMRLVVDEGVLALTIHRLAKELDYTVGALYRYFPSKEALFTELQRRVIDTFGEYLASADVALGDLFVRRRVRPDVAALTLLLNQAALYERLPRDMPDQAMLISRALASYAAEPSDGAPPITAALAPILARVAKLFRRAEECGALAKGNAKERTLLYWSALHGAVQLERLQVFKDAGVDPKGLNLSTAKTLLLGFGARPARLLSAVRLLRSNR